MDRIEYGTDGNTYKFWISNGKEYADSDRAISLNAVIDAIEYFQMNPQHFDFVNLIDDIKQLPSVSQPKTGHWEDGSPISWICSECGYQVRIYNNTNFCPNCGAKMFEPQESEDNE